MFQKSRKKSTNPAQKSRAQYQCPLPISSFLENDKHLSPMTVLLSPEKIGEEYNLQASPYFSENFDNQDKRLQIRQKLLQECIKDFSDLFKKFFLLKFSLKNSVYVDEAFNWYEEFYRRRIYFQSIARFFAQLRAGNNEYVGIRSLRTSTGEILRLPTIDALLYREGTIGKVVSEGAVLFDNIDLDRIRECLICNRIFWANREDKETCSLACANNLRVRRYRELTPEEKAARKARREANRNYKKRTANKLKNRD